MFIICAAIVIGNQPKYENSRTYFGMGENGAIAMGGAISVWDHDIGGLFVSESGVALLDLELELKLWNHLQ